MTAHFTLNGKTHIAAEIISPEETSKRWWNWSGPGVLTACRLSFHLNDGQLDGPGVHSETTCGNCKRSKLGKLEKVA